MPNFFIFQVVKLNFFLFLHLITRFNFKVNFLFIIFLVKFYFLMIKFIMINYYLILKFAFANYYFNLFVDLKFNFVFKFLMHKIISNH
jgi:hypothetical protein